MISMNLEKDNRASRRLKGKSAVVTGSAAGIGKATAMLFASEGARMVVSDIDEDPAREVVNAIVARGGEAMFVKADVSNPDDAKQLIETTVQSYGQLDVLVNNAAVYRGDGNILGVPDEVWDKVMAV